MPRRPSEQGPNPLSPRRPLRNGSFGGKGPGKLNAFGGAPERGKRVSTPGSGGSWGGGGGGGGKGGDGCAVLIVGGVLGALSAVTAAAGAIGGWWA